MLATREAWDSLGKGMSGALMLSTAWALRNSPLAGPNYYEFINDKNETFDVRAYQPFASYMFLAEVAKNGLAGTKGNISANEWLDAVVGVRRLSEVPIFAFPDIIRAFNNDDPNVAEEAVAKPLGQWFAGFFQPANVIREAFGLAAGYTGHKEAAAAAQANLDMGTQQLTGPARSSMRGLPIVGQLSSDMPAKVDPITGTSKTPAYPTFQFLLGGGNQPKSELQKLIEETGVEYSTLQPNLGNPFVNAEAAKRMGSVLQSSTASGKTIADSLASMVRDMNVRPEVAKFIVENILTSLQGDVREQLSADPTFGPYILRERFAKKRNVPSPLRQEAVKALEQQFPSLRWR
jgi:hypothetical protein